jgi:hypothetical protein
VCEPPATSAFTVDHNKTGANTLWDCLDAYPHNDVWTANVGIANSPATLCSPH